MTTKLSLQLQQDERGMMEKQQGLVIAEKPPQWRFQPEQCSWKGQERLEQKEQLKISEFNYQFLQEGEEDGCGYGLIVP